MDISCLSGGGLEQGAGFAPKDGWGEDAAGRRGNDMGAGDIPCQTAGTEWVM